MTVTSKIEYDDSTKHTSVEVAGEFSEWNHLGLALENENSTRYSVAINDITPDKTYMYKFIVDGNWVLASDGREVTHDEHGNSNHILIASSRNKDASSKGAAAGPSSEPSSSTHSETEDPFNHPVTTTNTVDTTLTSATTVNGDFKPKISEDLDARPSTDSSALGEDASDVENDEDETSGETSDSTVVQKKGFWVARFFRSFFFGISSFLRRVFKGSEVTQSA